MPWRRLLVLPLLMAITMGLDLPEDVPVPIGDPRRAQSDEKSPPIPAAKPADDVSKPETDAATDDGAPPDPSAKPDFAGPQLPPRLPTITAPEISETALADCEAELRKLGAEFKREDSVNGENGCGIEAPYRIDRIIRGVSFSPASQLRCETALALARWTDKVVVPAAAAMPDSVTLTQINHGSTYVCRRRNNLATGKMSEHAIGNAVDIMSFEFAGRKPMGISPRTGDGNMDEAFQRAVRAGACLHFTTVLGPGANASHAGHLHLDIAKRNRGYRLCE